MGFYQYTIHAKEVIQDSQNHQNISLICEVRAPCDHHIAVKWYRSKDNGQEEAIQTSSSQNLINDKEKEYIVVANYPIDYYNMYEYRCQIEFRTKTEPSSGYCQLPPPNIVALISGACGLSYMCCAKTPNAMVSKYI